VIVAASSQYGQDTFIVELLEAKRNGYFLDVGASNGLDSSNTYLLERNFGWSGLCIEPNTRFFDQLVRNRRCRSVNACLYDRVGEVEFLEAAGSLGGVVADFHPRQLAFAMKVEHLRLDAQGGLPLVCKKTTTLAAVLDGAGAPPVIDYWSLDVEGAELRLLTSFPFDRYTFNVLTVEHNRATARFAIRRFLEARGYEFVTSFVIDDCYIRAAAFPTRHSRSAVWRRNRLGRPGLSR
jgi:FkbM family methyltransferase